MDQQYFIKRGERVRGPFTSKQIKSGIRSEKIKQEDLVGRSEAGPWKEVRSVLPQEKSASPQPGSSAVTVVEVAPVVPDSSSADPPEETPQPADPPVSSAAVDGNLTLNEFASPDSAAAGAPVPGTSTATSGQAGDALDSASPDLGAAAENTAENRVQPDLTIHGHDPDATFVIPSETFREGDVPGNASDDAHSTARDLDPADLDVTLAPDVTPAPDVPDGEATLKVWDVATGEELFDMSDPPRPAGFYTSVAFFPSGNEVASVSWDGRYRLWDLTERAPWAGFKVHQGQGTTMAVYPGGRWMVTGGTDGQLAIHDTLPVFEKRRPPQPIQVRPSLAVVNQVAVSPDGTRLAAAYNGGLYVLDGITGNKLLTLKGHRGRQTASVAFSADGKRLASASADGTVRIRDARPWTRELRAQAQARNVLKRYRQQVESLENLRAQVRDAEHLSGLARERALEWSELFWINREEQ